MDTALGIVLFVFLLLAIIFSAVFFWLKRLKNQRVEALLGRYPQHKKVIPSASFFGQESKGVGQVRGNGTLVITDDLLVFEMWLPRRELVIPRKNIVRIETPISFLGKTRGTQLLKVIFQDSAGAQDSAAWQAHDLSALKSMLESS